MLNRSILAPEFLKKCNSSYKKLSLNLTLTEIFSLGHEKN